MRAGYANVDITPPPGEEMTGYGYFLNRRATGALDMLMARALSLEEGGARAVVVQLDLLGLSKDFVADIRAETARRFNLPGSHLLLHCTHTHSGPATMRVHGCGSPSEGFLFALRQQVLTVISAALDNLRPVSRAQVFDGEYPCTSGEPCGIAHNRVGTTDLDNRLRGLWIELETGPPILVVSYACHPVTLGPNHEYSADYPGALIREFNSYGITALYLNGCCGDINPLTHAYQWGSGTKDTLLIYGRDLARAVRQVMQGARTWQTGPIQALSRMVPLDAHEPSVGELEAELDEHRSALAEAPTDGRRRVEVMWREGLLNLAQSGRLAVAREAEIQAIACGDVVFVGLAAETFTRLGQIIRQSAPNHHLMIAATSNGVLGYIATREDAEQRAYASWDACKIYGMLLPNPGAGEQWAAEGARIVAEVTRR